MRRLADPPTPMVPGRNGFSRRILDRIIMSVTGIADRACLSISPIIGTVETCGDIPRPDVELIHTRRELGFEKSQDSGS